MVKSPDWDVNVPMKNVELEFLWPTILIDNTVENVVWHTSSSNKTRNKALKKKIIFILLSPCELLVYSLNTIIVYSHLTVHIGFVYGV